MAKYIKPAHAFNTKSNFCFDTIFWKVWTLHFSKLLLVIDASSDRKLIILLIFVFEKIVY